MSDNENEVKKIRTIVFEKEKKRRTDINKWNNNYYDFSCEKERMLINNIYMEEEITDEMQDAKKVLMKSLKKKLSSYIQQDKKKDAYDPKFIITIDQIIELLVESKLDCCYCYEKVKLFYEHVREEKQWTLERIDNDYGHNYNNCKIACLDCNLKRRTLDDNKFLFSKQMKIIKKEE